MSTATRATGSRSLTAWSFATVPSYQNRGSDHASVSLRCAAGGRAHHAPPSDRPEARRAGGFRAAPIRGADGRSGADGVAELVGPVGELPGEVGLGAAEVPVGGTEPDFSWELTDRAD